MWIRIPLLSLMLIRSRIRLVSFMWIPTRILLLIIVMGSPTTGLQILYYCIFSLHASIVSVHGPPRLHIEPPQLLSCQLCLGSQPGRTLTLPPVCGSNGPPSATRHLRGGGGLWCIPISQPIYVMWTTLHTVPCYVNSTTVSVPIRLYMMSVLLVASVHVYAYHLPTQHCLPVLWNHNYFLRFRFRLLKSYCSGSGSDFWQVKVPVPAPVPVPYVYHKNHSFKKNCWKNLTFLNSKLFEQGKNW